MVLERASKEVQLIVHHLGGQVQWMTCMVEDDEGVIIHLACRITMMMLQTPARVHSATNTQVTVDVCIEDDSNSNVA